MAKPGPKLKSVEEKRKFTGFMFHPSTLPIVQALADTAGVSMSKYVESLIIKATQASSL